MQFIRRIKQRLGLGPTPVRHGHVYVDQITGEPFEVLSVGRSVQIERLDAENRPESTIRKEKMRRAIDGAFIEHDTNRCPTCRDQ